MMTTQTNQTWKSGFNKKSYLLDKNTMAKKTKGFLKDLKKGALHKELGVKAGEKIPAKKLSKALNSKNPTERKRAQFAENAKKWKKK